MTAMTEEEILKIEPIPLEDLGPRTEDLTGKRFGRLLVMYPIRLLVPRTKDKPVQRVKYVCVCCCTGSITSVYPHHLTSGLTTSCGCVAKETRQAANANRSYVAGSEGSGLYAKKISSIRLAAERRGYEYSVTPEYLNSIWTGKCAISGVDIEMTNVGKILDTASLDRIDNSKGYIEGNVQWVHKEVNLMKRTNTDEEFIRWARQIVSYQDTKTEEKCTEMTDKIDVLDHGFVRLVDSMGDDLSIVRNARVSYDAEWRAGEDSGSDNRLINYLYSNGHNTPFEAVTVTFDVKAPIFVFRQWHRHRTQSYNELSARYRPLPEEFYIPEAHLIGKQNADNKQMRDPLTLEEYETLPAEEKAAIEEVRSTMRLSNKQSFAAYNDMIERGVPRELARSVLPVATYSHMFATMNLHNLFRFLSERLHTHAQYEIRVYAEAMLELIRPIVPVAVEAFEKKLDRG